MADEHLEVLASLPVHGVPSASLPVHPLRVDGLVRRPAVLTTADLAVLPHADVTEDFVCRAGWCVPGLHWQGVSLATVLDLVDADPEAPFVQVSAGDFRTPLSRSQAERALLATHIGDAPLPPEHGGPVRLLVPGADCYTSVKWVNHIELRRSPGDDTAQQIALERLGRRATAE